MDGFDYLLSQRSVQRADGGGYAGQQGAGCEQFLGSGDLVGTQRSAVAES